MTAIPNSNFLKNVLRFDAATGFAMGLGLTIMAKPLSQLLELPAPLLVGAGASLFPFAALLLAAASRQRIPQAMLGAIVLLNAGWAVDSFLLGLAGWVTPNALGSLFLYGQGLAVAGLATLQALAWRWSLLRS